MCDKSRDFWSFFLQLKAEEAFEWSHPPKKQNSLPFSTNGAFSTLSLFQVMTYCNQTKLVVFVSPVNSHTVRQCET